MEGVLLKIFHVRIKKVNIDNIKDKAIFQPNII